MTFASEEPLIIDDAGNASSYLRERLLQSLPHYSIPSVYVRMESLPLHASGKVCDGVLFRIENTTKFSLSRWTSLPKPTLFHSYALFLHVCTNLMPVLFLVKVDRRALPPPPPRVNTRSGVHTDVHT